MTAALYVVIVAMLFQQAMSYMAAQVLPSAAPQVGEALGLAAELVLYHTALFYAVSGIFQASVGGLIIRWGAIRASQLSLITLGAGLFLSMTGELWAFTLAAIIMGAGNSFSTPASSHLLARHSPKKYAPLIFSIKQTGVPVGGLIAVVMVQVLVDDDNVATWPDAFLATGLICIALMVVLQPMRRQFDADRTPGYPVRFSDGIHNIRTAWRNPNLRNLCWGMFAFVGLQGLFNSIFATYAQLDLGMDKRTALDILVVVNITAALARILWGWIGSSLAPSRIVLSALAFIMAAATIALGAATSEIPVWLIATAALAFGASALSWHGLLLSEVARMAPAGQVGPVTGGVLFFGALGMLTYPFVAKQLLDFGVGYNVIFFLASVPALLMGFKLLLSKAAPADAPAAPKPASQTEPAPALHGQLTTTVAMRRPRHTYRFRDAVVAELQWAKPTLKSSDIHWTKLLGRRRRSF
jgi:MFS family permease